MKRKTFMLTLLCEAVILSVGSIVVFNFPDYFKNAGFPFDEIGLLFSVDGGNPVGLFAYPFEWIGEALSELSSLGSVFSGIAALILVALTFLFFVPFLKSYKNKDTLCENIVLAITGVMFFYVVYSFSTMKLFYEMPLSLDEKILPIAKAVLGSGVWSGVFCCFALKILRIFKSSNKDKLLQFTNRIVFAVSFVLVFVLCNIKLPELLTSLEENVENANSFIALFGFACVVVTYILNIMLLFSFSDLANAMLSSADAQTINALSGKLSDFCVRAVIVMVVISFVENCLQIAFCSTLSDVKTVVSIPLLNLGFALLVLVFSNLVSENKQLKDDNELIV